MARINDGSRPAAFTRDAARRIQRVVQIVERGDRSQPGTRLGRMSWDDGDPVRLGKTTAAWTKNTLATIELWEEGTPPTESARSPTALTLTDCVNKFADIEADSFVMLARGLNGYWYLIAAECDSAGGSGS